MKNNFAIAVVVSFSLFGCANGPAWLRISQASPQQFHSYNCEQIDAELGRLYARVKRLGVPLDETAVEYRWLVAGSRVYWPANFMPGADQAEEFSRLTGEFEALELLAKEKQCELDSGVAGSSNEAGSQAPPGDRSANWPRRYPSYTLLPSGAVVADPPTVLTGASSIPVRAVSESVIFKKRRGDVCDRYISGGDYCWWSPPGNYSMCPPIASYAECKALYGAGCQLGHGKVLPLC